MSRLIYDIETDGLLHAMTKVHCICTMDVDTRVMRAYYVPPAEGPAPELPPAGDIADGIAALNAAEVRVGHNIACFDEIALRRFGLALDKNAAGSTGGAELFDTLVVARTIWPDEHLKALDYQNLALGKGRLLNKALFGRQSLEAWGLRIGVEKSDFGKQTESWATFTLPMLRYCMQDVRATAELHRVLSSKVAKGMASLRTIAIETEFARVISAQMDAGFRVDPTKLEALVAMLSTRRAELDAHLAATVPPFEDKYVTPKKKIEKVRVTKFNPGSRPHVARHLIERHGWEPVVFTATGRPKLTNEILSEVDLPGVDDIKEYFKVEKILGMAAEGEQSWQKKLAKPSGGRIPDGRLYGYVNHNGAVTGRCTHSEPNITQVPKLHKGKDRKPRLGYAGRFGFECRDVFIPRDGWKLVGCDASGLELRMLAHYMAKYDGGEYVKVVTEGDVHSRNMRAAGLTDRDQAKRFIYAFLYGAGNAKLGVVLGCSATAAKDVRVQFLRGLPALRRVIIDVKAAAKAKGVLPLPTGRRLYIRSEHAALNTLLQGTGALVMKVACVLYQRNLLARGVVRGVDYNQVHQAHDEVQIECRPEIAEAVGKCAADAIREAGERIGLVCPLAGEWAQGNTWAETHG